LAIFLHAFSHEFCGSRISIKSSGSCGHWPTKVKTSPTFKSPQIKIVEVEPHALTITALWWARAMPLWIWGAGVVQWVYSLCILWS
jgi:hypothetical protein